MIEILKELVKRKLLDKKLATEIEYQSKKEERSPEDILLEKKLISEKTLFKIKSELLGIPLKDVVPADIPTDLLEFIPEESVLHYKMVPLSRHDHVLEVGMVHPENLKAQEALSFLAREKGFSYKVVLIPYSVWRTILKRYKTLNKEIEEALEVLEAQSKEKQKTEKSPVLDFQQEISVLEKEAPIAKIVNALIRHAVEGKASDIHIEPLPEKVRVRFRTMGQLHSSITIAKEYHSPLVARIKILSNMRIDETRRPQDGRFSVNFEGTKIDFRVSTFPTALGEKVVIRVLDPSKGLLSFEELGLRKDNIEILKSSIEKPYGLILVTGPTGSGKSTTLYSVLNYLNKETVNIVTLEDPVEYFMEGVNQAQVNPEIGFTFARGLRHILRQDPDIIMVGEIRDLETVELTIHAALTGHLVLSTLHTNNAVGAIPRMIDMGIEPFLIPPTLELVIAQRLVRVLCQDCAQRVLAKARAREIIEKQWKLLPEQVRESYPLPQPLYIYKSTGCKKCNNTGYIGRTGIFELLKITDPIGELMLKKPSESKLFELAKKEGLVTMMQDGILKVLQGITSLEEVLRVALEK